MFNIGDKVTVEGDHPDSHWVVMMIYYDLNKVGILYSTKHGTVQRVVDPLDLKLVDPKDDIKQAIREVLLSEEFLAAFAKAWQKTPLVYNEELNTRPTYANGEIV